MASATQLPEPPHPSSQMDGQPTDDCRGTSDESGFESVSAESEEHSRLALDDLPSELWCKIWDHLPFADRIFVTHVCRKWPAVALEWSAMWSDITLYTSIQSDSEGSDDDDYEDDDDSVDTWSDSRRAYCSNTTTINAAHILLARSRAVPLHITVNLISYDSEKSMLMLEDLAATLASHSERIVSLSVCAEDSSPTAGFLWKLGSLPSLRTLSSERPTTTYGYTSTCPLFPHDWVQTTAAPRLEVLRMDGYRWPDSDEFTPCTGIRELHISPYCEVEPELITVLKGCPSLQKLHVDLGPVTNYGEPQIASSTEELHLLSASIPNVTISNIHATHEAWVMAAFHSDSRPYFSLVYDADVRALTDGNQILCDLDGQVQLTLKHQRLSLPWEGLQVAAHATDADGCRRCITQSDLHYGVTPSPSDCLARLHLEELCDRVGTLTVDAAIFRDCLGALPDASNIANLELVEDGSQDLAVMNTEFFFGLNYSRSAKLLETLTLKRGPSGERMSAEEIALLVHHVSVRTNRAGFPGLKRLRVDTTLIMRDGVGLRELADCVVVERV